MPVTIEVEGLIEARKCFDVIQPSRRATLLQQSINTAGRDVRVVARRMVQDLLPIKVSLLNSRVRFDPQGKKGPARIRFIGWGKYRGSGEVKPRYMKLKYPIVRVRQAAHLGASANRRRAKMNAISYGVGAVGRRSVINGFVVNVLRGRKQNGGRNFVPSYSDWFQERRASVFQRTRSGARRRKGNDLPIAKVSGPTVGEIAQRAGIVDKIAPMFADRAATEFVRRCQAEVDTVRRR